MDNEYTYYLAYRYYGVTNQRTVICLILNVVDVLTVLESQFNCTAQIRVTKFDHLDELRPGDEIWGKFGNTDRDMRIDAIHYDDLVNTCVIHCVQSDMWVYSHKIAFDYDLYKKAAGALLTPYHYWQKTTFPQKLYILYSFVVDSKLSEDSSIPNDFPKPKVQGTYRLPPVLGKSLTESDHANVTTSFYMHISTVRDIMGSVVGQYKPAWNADTQIRFYEPWTHHLSRDADMIRVVSHGRSSHPNVGYGRGGETWAREVLQDETTIQFGMKYERIYDLGDEYDTDLLPDLTKQNLDNDKNESEWWEVEVINDGGQELWIGDIVVGDFVGMDADEKPRKTVISRITYDQTPDRLRTYLHLGSAPATVTDRLNALRLAARRDLELTWMKGLAIDKLATVSQFKKIKNQNE